MVTNLTIFGLWMLLAVIPFCIGPPATFSWKSQTFKGIVGAMAASACCVGWPLLPLRAALWLTVVAQAGSYDPQMEQSFFYYGAYERVHLIGSFEYRMDLSYMLCVVLMFVCQVWGMVSGMLSCDIEIQQVPLQCSLVLLIECHPGWWRGQARGLQAATRVTRSLDHP